MEQICVFSTNLRLFFGSQVYRIDTNRVRLLRSTVAVIVVIVVFAYMEIVSEQGSSPSINRYCYCCDYGICMYGNWRQKTKVKKRSKVADIRNFFLRVSTTYFRVRFFMEKGIPVIIES
jgi:hypothetical protein